MADPHEQKRITRDHYARKTDVNARLFTVLDWAAEDRDMTLMPHLSRAVRRGDILELAATDEADIQPGGTVQRIAYLGFAEVLEAGLLLSGDSVTTGREALGSVVGFDETHMPNHLNVILKVETQKTGREVDLTLDALVTFAGVEEENSRRIGFRANPNTSS